MTGELIGWILGQLEENFALLRDLVITGADFDGDVLAELLVTGKPNSRITALAQLVDYVVSLIQIVADLDGVVSPGAIPVNIFDVAARLVGWKICGAGGHCSPTWPVVLVVTTRRGRERVQLQSWARHVKKPTSPPLKHLGSVLDVIEDTITQCFREFSREFMLQWKAINQSATRAHTRY